MKTVSVSSVTKFFKESMNRLAIPDEVSDTVSSSLIEASLFGIDSHGVNLFKHYLDCVKKGRVSVQGKLSYEIRGATVVCDADRNFAHYAASKLLGRMDSLSSDSGISFGAIINSDHIGAVGIHAANSGILGKIILGFTNADALANTPDGKSTVFGTNPISLIYRHSDDELLYIDLATTQFSMNRVKNYRRLKKALPNGVARDKKYQVTTIADEAVTLEPIGGHKGFALAFLVEILTSSILGRDASPDVMSMYNTDLSHYRNVSHSFIMIDPEVLFGGGANNVWATIEGLRARFHNEQLANSPGIKELKSRKERIAMGIPMLDDVLSEWTDMGFKDD